MIDRVVLGEYYYLHLRTCGIHVTALLRVPAPCSNETGAGKALPIPWTDGQYQNLRFAAGTQHLGRGRAGILTQFQ